MRAYERLLRYVCIHTASDETSQTLPSTDRQFDLARYLVKEMREIGIKDARVDDSCYVYGTLPATPGYEDRVSLGFIAHLDTSPDFSGDKVKPLIWENYDGSDIRLKEDRIISADMFPHLNDLKGKTLITADGTTLLGADDKAGIADIMTLAEELINSDSPHGKISIAFTPDEEIGHGAEALDLKAFGAEYAYTVDGGPANEIEYDNFNAGAADFLISGKSVHPGEAKNKMINAALVAVEIVSMLPSAETPAHTEGKEGFYHLTGIEGNVDKAKVSFIIRDHSFELYEGKQKTLDLIAKILNEKYGEGTVTLSFREQYRNMKEKILPCMHLIDNAKEAIVEAGLTPVEIPIRGGTDGAQLSYRGLPCPNLGAGGYAFHGPYEHATVEGMDDAVRVLHGIVNRYAKQKEE